MSERDVIDLLQETRNWLCEVGIGDAAPAIDAGIAEITRLREEVERLRMTPDERESLELLADYADSRDEDRVAADARALLARHGGER